MVESIPIPDERRRADAEERVADVDTDVLAQIVARSHRQTRDTHSG